MDAIFRDNIYSFLRNLDNSKMRRFGKIFHDVTVSSRNSSQHQNFM